MQKMIQNVKNVMKVSQKKASNMLNNDLNKFHN